MIPIRRRALSALAATALGLVGAAPAPADPVLAAAGDIACAPTSPFFLGGNGDATHCAQKRTAALIGAVNAVLPLGDNQYNTGSLTNYNAVFAKTWGVYKGISFPVPGNHEYGSTGASGYFSYFGARAGTRGQGWYSFDLGGWHVLALNSECNFIGTACNAGGAEEAWVRQDLAAHPALCTLAFWHEPRFSSGSTIVTNAAAMAPIWNDLYDAGADLVLVAHKHSYERLAALDKAGNVDNARGMREIIVGTGGDDHAGRALGRIGSQVRNFDSFGVLKLTMHPTGYDFQFVPEAGRVFTDAGSGTCHAGGTVAPAAAAQTVTKKPKKAKPKVARTPLGG